MRTRGDRPFPDFTGILATGGVPVPGRGGSPFYYDTGNLLKCILISDCSKTNLRDLASMVANGFIEKPFVTKAKILSGTSLVYYDMKK